MIISIIGTGNIATVLGRLSLAKGHRIKQVISRDEAKGVSLAAMLHAEYSKITDPPDTVVDLFLVAVSDHALPQAVAGMNFRDVPVIHTAGAVATDILKDVSHNYGVLYPLQSLRKELHQVPEIPFLIDGNNNFTKVLVENFARTLSDTVDIADEAKRIRLHAAAVIVNNFTNYLYSAARELCEKEDVDFDLLKPLIRETAERVMVNLPADVQTGPAIRKDISTLDKHLKLLTPYPKLRTMYMRMSDNIMNP